MPVGARKWRAPATPIRCSHYSRERGLKPPAVYEARELQTALGLVAAEVGVCLVPVSVERLRRDNVMYRPLNEEKAVSPIIMSTRKGDKSPEIAFIVKLIREIYRKAGDQLRRLTIPARVVVAPTNGAAGLPPAPEMLYKPRQLRLVPKPTFTVPIRQRLSRPEFKPSRRYGAACELLSRHEERSVYTTFYR
jgi:hypothetical protein